LTRRFEYNLDLNGTILPPPELPASLGVVVRHPSTADIEHLSILMLDAYRGTVDYDGETIEEARTEVQSYFQALNHVGRGIWLTCSSVAKPGSPTAGESSTVLCGACLVGYWPEREAPLISYAMTVAGWKGRGLAGMLLRRSLRRLKEQGYPKVYAVITQGNIPSESLFSRAGFERVNP